MARRDARRAQERPGLRAEPRHAARAGPGVPRPALGGAPRRGRPLARGRDRGDEPPGRLGRLGALPGRGPGRAAPLHAGGADGGHDGGRDGAHPLHVRDDEGSEGSRPHACLHVGPAGPGSTLARRPRGRRRVVHGGNGMGEGDLELSPRPVVARRRDRPARGAVRRGGAPLADSAARRHRALPGAHRVPDAREARAPRRGAPAAPAPRRLGRRAAQPGGDRALPGRARAHGARRLRPDRELAARREPSGRSAPGGVDGPPDARPRRRRDRRVGARLPAGCGGRRGVDRPAADALRRVLGRARGDGGRLPRRLVRHGRPGRPGRGWVPLVRRPLGRCHSLGRLPHRAVRGRERSARAPGGRGERRRRRARPRPRPDRQGVRRAPAGPRAG